MGFRKKEWAVKVCVQGLWHLGSVTSACLASVGHNVVGLDSEHAVVSLLNDCKAPIFEPDLNPLVAKGIQSGRLRFTCDMESACKDAEILWVTFDTPINEDDTADIDWVMNQIKSAVMILSDGALVLVSSQLPVGSIALLEKFVIENLINTKISFASSPENLRLGKSLDIFLHPDRIVVGIRSPKDRLTLIKLLSPITEKIEWMSIESAEMTKHAINVFLATSVAFANEIAVICEMVGANAIDVSRGLKSDSRIGAKAYLSPGGPFAGGTLARDIEFLDEISQKKNLLTPLLSSIGLSNDAHKNWVRHKLLEHFTDLRDIKVSIWGLTYKGGTDTLRRSLSVELVDWLLERGAKVQVYDPIVKELPFKWINLVKNCVNADENLWEIQVLIVGNDLPEFKIEAHKLHKFANSNLLIIDADRHIYESIKEMSIDYISVGIKQSQSKYNKKIVK